MPEISSEYVMTPIHLAIQIEHLVSVHYFEYSKNYIFEGESHDFWEFLYVDKGEIHVMADSQKFVLSKGNIIFHKPNEWHNVIANGVIAPNLIVVSFDSPSESMSYFNNKILNISDSALHHLTQIIKEAKNAFASDLSDPTLKKLTYSNHSSFASEQLIKLHLEMMLIEMLRMGDTLEMKTRTSSSIKEYALEDKLRIVTNYLKENIYQQLSLEDICRNTALARSSLQKLFKETLQTSVMEYFKQLKIEEAKTMIREGNHNFTEISQILGYNSIHYFSRTFKQTTDMTLSEYASSVKGRL